MRIKIKVIPCSSQSLIEEDSVGDLRVKVKAPPVQGKANKELIELLTKYYKVPKNQIKIIKGQTSKNKIIEINC